MLLQQSRVKELGFFLSFNGSILGKVMVLILLFHRKTRFPYNMCMAVVSCGSTEILFSLKEFNCCSGPMEETYLFIKLSIRYWVNGNIQSLLEFKLYESHSHFLQI